MIILGVPTVAFIKRLVVFSSLCFFSLCGVNIVFEKTMRWNMVRLGALLLFGGIWCGRMLLLVSSSLLSHCLFFKAFLCTHVVIVSNVCG